MDLCRYQKMAQRHNDVERTTESKERKRMEKVCECSLEYLLYYLNVLKAKRRVENLKCF